MDGQGNITILENGSVTIFVYAFGGEPSAVMTLEISALLGDVDSNGEVNVQDAYLTMVEYAEIAAGSDGSFTGKQNYVGDVDLNDTITIQDAYLIQVYYASAAAGSPVEWETLRE